MPGDLSCMGKKIPHGESFPYGKESYPWRKLQESGIARYEIAGCHGEQPAEWGRHDEAEYGKEIHYGTGPGDDELSLHPL